MARFAALALILAAAAFPATGQGTALKGAGQDGAVPAYDPKPFLATMVNYRRTAITCATSIGPGPVEDSQSIDDYLIALGQTPPNREIAGLANTLSKFIRAQAASICQDKLAQAYNRYVGTANVYQQRKPEVWPEAPRISPGPWCQTVACSELR